MTIRLAAAPQLDHVTDWVFDLDNTLYPAECDLFAEIDTRMTDFVARLTGLERTEARKLQKQLYEKKTVLIVSKQKSNEKPRHRPKKFLNGLVKKLKFAKKNSWLKSKQKFKKPETKPLRALRPSAKLLWKTCTPILKKLFWL